MIKKPVRFVILGAGRPFSGEQHPVLRGILDHKVVMEWILQAASFLKPEIYFIGGYQYEIIAEKYPDINYQINTEWESTGATASFFTAQLDSKYDYLLSYSDILFRQELVLKLYSTSFDIAVAIDSKWRQRYSNRSHHDLVRCEKVHTSCDIITRAGADINPELADAEFIGLVLIREPVIRYIQQNIQVLSSNLKESNISDLIEMIRISGICVGTVDVFGDWAELNEPQDLVRFVLGTKAASLARLEGLLQKSCIEEQACFTVEEWCRSPEAITKRIRTLFSKKRLIIRSSALSEDGFSSSNAGVCESVLNVDMEVLERSIETVIASYPVKNQKNEVLVQPMVEEIAASGVVLTRTLNAGAPYYVINYDDSTCSTESITSGACCEQKTLIIYRNENFNEEDLPVVIRPLIASVQEIEQLLHYDALDIEFGISTDGIVHIFQVRPIAVNHETWGRYDEEVCINIQQTRQQFILIQRPSPFILGKKGYFGIMPDWNPAEIIGTNPGQLAQTLYSYLIMDEVWATQRAEYGYRDVRPSPLLVTFAGHPYVDIRASFNSFIPKDLDEDLAERLVDFYLGWLRDHPSLHDKVEFDVVPTCFGLDFERWEERLIHKGGFTIDEICTLGEALKAITFQAFSRNKSDLTSIEQLENRFARIMNVEMPPLERALILLEDCRRYGTLSFSHLARSAFIAVTLLRSAVSTGVIDKKAMDDFLNSIRTITHQFTHDARATYDGQMTWESFVTRYGHLRPGTYDITSPCYAEDPEHYLRPIVQQAYLSHAETPDTGTWSKARDSFSFALSDAGLPVTVDTIERFMREAIEGREYAKFVFTKNLSVALDCLIQYGKIHGITRKELDNIPLSTFFSIRSGRCAGGKIADTLHSIAVDNASKRHIASVLELPPLLFSEVDFGLFSYPCNQPNYVGNTRLTGECISFEMISSGDTVDLSGRIVLIPQADPGYDWLFGQGISGLITMYGGANSHMTIRAAEFGLPAAIGVGEVLYQSLAKARVLELDPENRRIRVIR